MSCPVHQYRVGSQAPCSFCSSLVRVLALNPENITVHTLALKKGADLFEKREGLSSAEAVTAMVDYANAQLRSLGYKPYYLYRQKNMAGNQENIGYAIPGHACQYNVDIMEETTHILALGAGGISKRVYEDEGHIGRAPNVANIEHYIARVDEMIQRKRELFGC